MAKPKFAERLHGRDLFFTCGEQCCHLTSTNGRKVRIEPEEELFSSQEEADTRIILHCDHISRNFSETTVIIVRSPDTDVLVLLSKFPQNINQLVLFEKGMGNKRRLLNIKETILTKGENVCSVLPALHAFTGCDTTSSFDRRGKIASLKILEKKMRIHICILRVERKCGCQIKRS